MTSPAIELLDKAGYPLPWHTVETWSGRAILAANGKHVVLIRRGGASTPDVGREYMLATLIAGAVNHSYDAPAVVAAPQALCDGEVKT